MQKRIYGLLKSIRKKNSMQEKTDQGFKIPNFLGNIAESIIKFIITFLDTTLLIILYPKIFINKILNDNSNEHNLSNPYGYFINNFILLYVLLISAITYILSVEFFPISNTRSFNYDLKELIDIVQTGTYQTKFLLIILPVLIVVPFFAYISIHITGLKDIIKKYQVIKFFSYITGFYFFITSLILISVVFQIFLFGIKITFNVSYISGAFIFFIIYIILYFSLIAYPLILIRLFLKELQCNRFILRFILFAIVYFVNIWICFSNLGNPFLIEKSKGYLEVTRTNFIINESKKIDAIIVLTNKTKNRYIIRKKDNHYIRFISDDELFSFNKKFDQTFKNIKSLHDFKNITFELHPNLEKIKDEAQEKIRIEFPMNPGSDFILLKPEESLTVRFDVNNTINIKSISKLNNYVIYLSIKGLDDIFFYQ